MPIGYTVEPLVLPVNNDSTVELNVRLGNDTQDITPVGVIIELVVVATEDSSDVGALLKYRSDDVSPKITKAGDPNYQVFIAVPAAAVPSAAQYWYHIDIITNGLRVTHRAGPWVVGRPGHAVPAIVGSVLRTGDTMTGPLVLPGDPTTALQAAPKQYVDAHAALKANVHGIVDAVTHNYLRRAGITAPQDWIADWRTIRAQAAGRLVQGLTWGASVEEGYGATVRPTGGYIGLVTANIQALLGDGGSGFISVLGAPFYSSGGVGNGLVTSSGVWTPFDDGLAGAMATTVAVNATITFTVRGTQVRVWYAPFLTAGTVTVTIDGGAPDTFSAAAASTVTHKDYTVGAGTHTVVVKNNQAGGLWLYGVEGRNATGFVMHNMAHWGKTSAQGAVVAWPGAGAAETSIKWTINSFAPDLVINAMGGNDVTAGTTLANFLAAAKTLDLWARLANPNVLGMYITDHIGENDTFAGYHAYVDQERLMCDTHGLAWYNAWAYGHANPQWMINAGYLGAGNVHPTTTGHAWMAVPVSALLAA